MIPPKEDISIVAKEDIIEMEQRMSSRDLSLDAPIDDNQELTHFDLLKETSPNQEDVLGEEEEKKIREQQVQSAMRHLNEKEEYIILLNKIQMNL